MAEAHRWIAVVDDDPSVLMALGRLLRTHAFTPRTFGSANAFIASLASGLPQCLIVDLQMAGMSGIDCSILDTQWDSNSDHCHNCPCRGWDSGSAARLRVQQRFC